jgi:hypothetical protein
MGCQVAFAVTADPSLSRMQRHRGLTSDGCQRNILFEMSAQLTEATERELAPRLGELGQRRRRGVRRA